MPSTGVVVVNTTKANIRVRVSSDGEQNTTDFVPIAPQKRREYPRTKPQVAFVYREDKSATEVHFVDVDATLVVQ